MITTGINSLNSLIQGYKGITCIYGPAATGKTTFAMIAAIHQAKEKKKTLYIDTENGFSPQRAVQLGANSTMLQSIFIYNIKNFSQQTTSLLSFTKIITSFSLLVIDTIGNYYRHDLQNDHASANAKMRQQLILLRQLALHTPVLLTNQVYQHKKQYIQVGGKFITDNVDTVIELSDFSNRVATLQKPGKGSTTFTITSSGCT